MIILELESLNGKLNPEQEEICREGNVRGVFGNPTKIVEETKELVKKYRINEEKIKYILDKYSSMQNFIKAFREGTLDKEDEKVFENNLNMYLDINGGTNRRYANLLREMDKLGLKTKTKTIDKELTIFDIGKIQEFLESNSRRMNIVARKFGIGRYEDEEEKSAKELAEFYGTTTTYMYSQIRHGVRNLMRSDGFRKKCIEYKSIPARANLETIEKYTQYEKERIEQIYDTIFDSNLIFYPDEEFAQEPDSMTSQEVSELLSELSSISKYADIRENITERDQYEYSEEQTGIEVLGLSHKIYYGLKRNGIHTIGQLRDFDKGELLTNLLDGNEECLGEIETALKDNQSLREEKEGDSKQDIDTANIDEEERKKEQERARKQLIDNNKKIGIEELDFWITTYKRLKRANINTVEDLVKLRSEDELKKVRGLSRVERKEVLQKIEMLPEIIVEYKERMARPYLKPYVEKKDFYVEPEMVSTTDFEFDEEDEIIQIEFDEEPETINTEEEELEESKQQMTEEPESVQEENEVEEEEPEITETELEKLKATRDSLEQEIEQIRAKVLEAEKLLASYDALLNGKDLDKKVPTEPRGE